MGKLGKNLLESLFKLQKKVLRIMTCSGYYAESDLLFRKLNILKLTQIYTTSVAVLMFKYIKGMLPPIFNETLVTHNSHKLEVSLCQTELYKKTIEYQGPTIWNRYENVNHQCSLQAFKKQMKRYLSDH